MAEKRTYKLVGRYPNEAVSFGGTCRVEFKNFFYTTSNPVEISAIESSSMFRDPNAPKILRVDEKTKMKAFSAPKAGTTGSPIGLTAPLDSNKDAEIDALKARVKSLEAENEEITKILDEKTAEPPSDPGTGDPNSVEDPLGGSAPGDETKKAEEDAGKKKADAKK